MLLLWAGILSAANAQDLCKARVLELYPTTSVGDCLQCAQQNRDEMEDAGCTLELVNDACSKPCMDSFQSACASQVGVRYHFDGSLYSPAGML